MMLGFVNVSGLRRWLLHGSFVFVFPLPLGFLVRPRCILAFASRGSRSTVDSTSVLY
jgi:hypothetical protein